MRTSTWAHTITRTAHLLYGQSSTKHICNLLPTTRHRADLVPVYSFGENELFRQVIFSEGSLGRRLQDLFKKIMGFAPCLFVGERLALMPYRIPITTVGEFVRCHAVCSSGPSPPFFSSTFTPDWFQWEAQSLCHSVQTPPRRRWTTTTDCTWMACQSYSTNIRSAVGFLKTTGCESSSFFALQTSTMRLYSLMLFSGGGALLASSASLD